MTRSICILLTSDVHLAISEVARLEKWIAENRKRVDAIFLTGDVCNCSDADQQLPEKISSAEGEFSSLLGAHENICTRVIYIPGNHDPKTLFESHPPHLTPHSTNIHGRTLRLARNLVVAGFGGSVPAFTGEKQVWAGYPYASDEQYGNDLRLFLQLDGSEEADDAVTSSDDLILLTHVGPDGADTACDQFDQQRYPLNVNAGSASLRQLLLQSSWQRRIVGVVHGHIHNGFGVSNVGKVQVVNPGSLRESRFGLLTLTQTVHNDRWCISAVELHKMC